MSGSTSRLIEALLSEDGRNNAIFPEGFDGDYGMF